ncbi:acetyl-CoA carboxylase biotin carboxyl carrier protein [Novosphingobium percolationis]|uniref:acetyl-CoA carboxylase biotin carboxyl carrier protein n=1 Tax=Novosphingobium percolationis TaxID=2871811 RepID=UPI001CD607A5|nr:biotin/lipoyl-containing protein [Novosphingobium percolationis]
MTQKPTIDHPVDHVRVLMEEFTRSGIATLHLRSGEFELLLSNDAAAPSLLGGQQAAPVAVAAPVVAAPAAPVAAAAPAAAAPVSTSVPDGAVVVAAPNLGTFYRAPKPGAAPYVEIGGRVAADDEICLIEVMKLFTAVKAGQAGKIVAILAEDGAMVEAGQPLFAMVAD